MTKSKLDYVYENNETTDETTDSCNLPSKSESDSNDTTVFKFSRSLTMGGVIASIVILIIIIIFIYMYFKKP